MKGVWAIIADVSGNMIRIAPVFLSTGPLETAAANGMHIAN
ncbi:MAG: hypothetical protein ACE5GK_03005 [Nitrospiria bacterium]